MSGVAKISVIEILSVAKMSVVAKTSVAKTSVCKYIGSQDVYKTAPESKYFPPSSSAFGISVMDLSSFQDEYVECQYKLNLQPGKSRNANF